MASDDEDTSMLEGARRISDFEAGRLQERVDGMKNDFTAFKTESNVRFLNLESTVREGFAQSQRDREAGNAKIGEMITEAQTSNDEKFSKLFAAHNKSVGSVDVKDKVINFIVVLLAAAIGGGLLSWHH